MNPVTINEVPGPPTLQSRLLVAHPLIREVYGANDNGVRPLRNGVLAWADRGAVWAWHGFRFGALGGGVSIDRAVRVENESWWPTETITDHDVEALITRAPDGLDVLGEFPRNRHRGTRVRYPSPRRSVRRARSRYPLRQLTLRLSSHRLRATQSRPVRSDGIRRPNPARTRVLGGVIHLGDPSGSGEADIVGERAEVERFVVEFSAVRPGERSSELVAAMTV
jgi:hypothetical protein